MKLLITAVLLILTFSCGHPEDGKDGQPGAEGAPGKPGIQGIPGPAGEVGPAGTNGTEGVEGQPGSDGTDGKDGQPGVDGIDGEAGQDGQDGITPAPFQVILSAQNPVSLGGKEGLVDLPGYISFQAFNPSYSSASRHYVRLNIIPLEGMSGTTKSFCYRRLLLTAIYLLEGIGTDVTASPCNSLPAQVVSGSSHTITASERIEFVSEDGTITNLQTSWELFISGIGTP